LVDNQALFIN